MVKGEFFRAGLAYAMSKKFVIYFTQKNISRIFEFKRRNSLQIEDCQTVDKVPALPGFSILYTPFFWYNDLIKKGVVFFMMTKNAGKKREQIR